jgi:CRISPR-associated protein Cmr2
VLACARELRETYRQGWKVKDNQPYLLMGEKATVSAGIAVVHYKEDLRFALERARTAEKAAKNGGRDALTLTICRRSGEHTSTLVPWEICPGLDALVGTFLQQVSDRWAYKLRAVMPTLQGRDIPWEAIRAETRRLLARLEKQDREQIEQRALTFFESCHKALTDPRRGQSPAQVFESFVLLCQAASFLARGRDE